VTAYGERANPCHPSSHAAAQMIIITAATVEAGATEATAGEGLGAGGRLAAMMTAIHLAPTSTWATYTPR
jgi:hypothetical protein